MDKQSILDVIPEDDKVCTNCKFFTDECGAENGRLCVNSGEAYYKERDEGIVYEDNYFEPDDLYISQDVATCENCEHYCGGDQDWDICVKCLRYAREDYWRFAG